MSKKFTLLEALVALAIIGILLSLLLPTLIKARKASRAATCANQMRQLSSADYMYTIDNDGKFCYVRYDKSTRLWDMYLGQQYLGAPITDDMRNAYSYIKESTHPGVYTAMKEMMFCPNDTGWLSLTWGTTPDSSVLRRSYAKSMRSSGVQYTVGGGEIHNKSLKTTKITNPSNFFQFIEHQSQLNMVGQKPGTGFLDAARWQLSAESLDKRTYHKTNHFNYAFVDGSVRSIDVNQAAASDSWTP